MNTLLQEIRFGLRVLRKNPGFTAVVVLTLALGIGANAAIFTVINAVMLRALPVQHTEQLVAVGNPARVHSYGTGTPRTDVFSYPLYREIRDHNDVFSSLLASSNLSSPQIAIDAGSEKVSGRLVTENYFQTLGVTALLGRTFTADESRIPGSDPFLVISYEYWQRRFSGDSTVIGRKVRLNNYPFTIIAIAPAGFFGEVVGDRPDVWAPMLMQPQLMPGRNFLESVNDASLLLMGRLKPGVTIDQARANLSAVVRQALTETLNDRMSSDDRDAMRKMRIAVEVSPGGRGLSRLRYEFSRPLSLLMAMVVLVLLISCFNVANLTLARAETRQREIALRFAIGASRTRIVRQLLLESALIAALGGALGLLLANWGSVALVNMANAKRDIGAPLLLGIDWRVLSFTGAICLSAAISFGLAPAMRFLRVRPGAGLKEESRDPELGSRGSFRRILITAQIALGALVLMTASLLVRSLHNLQGADLGYSRDQLLLARVDFLQSGYKGAAIQTATREVLARLAAVPGTQAVTASSNGLFSGDESSDSIRIDGVTPRDQQGNATADDEVGPNYFSTNGIPIVLGREITERDFSVAARVAVVNEAFAKAYLGAQNPIGHKIHLQDSDHPDQPPYEIVGVARDVHDHSIRDDVRCRMYAPLTSATFAENGSVNFELRAIGNPQSLVNSVRTALRDLNPNLVVDNVETARELVSDTLTSQIVVAKLSTLFAVLVLILVCVGLYGTMAYSVAARTREIGVRMALGARRTDVIWMVSREVWIVLAIGCMIGVLAAIAGARLFQALLFGVGKTDPPSIGAAILALAAVCVAAAVVPVQRATRVDPMVALRCE
jgi:predicted permease